MKANENRVISASRRVDMIAYPDLLYKNLCEKTPPERVHTLVIWTKKPENILNLDYLNNKLKEYTQLFIHLSITGMGNSILEPNIPAEEVIIKQIPELIKIVKNPERIAVRFDPIVHLKIKEKEYSNIQKAEKIILKCSKLGITRFITSWMYEYDKVINNLKKFDVEVLPVNNEVKLREMDYLKKITKSYNADIQVCCTKPFEISRCIDGYLFNSLHPEGEICSTRKAKGQRKHCGCTESWDIGWYYPCPNGCIYCYANPKIKF